MGEFRFKQFAVSDDRSGMKISTDGVLLGAWAEIPASCRRVTDLGAGSGLIALMLAQRLVPSRPDAEIFVAQRPGQNRRPLHTQVQEHVPRSFPQ